MSDEAGEKMQIEAFFAYTRERHRIYLRREGGDPGPWTQDPILQRFRFTCVFRELDRTTQWIRRNVRDDLSNSPECLLAMVVARWFNRIETLEVLFNQRILDYSDRGGGVGETPWSFFLRSGDTSWMRSALMTSVPNGPYVTGSYMIRSPTGMSKLDGILHLCKAFYRDSAWLKIAKHMLNSGLGEVTMEGFTHWLQSHPGQGPFLAYEVACDLQHTGLLNTAPDTHTWANVGPGCRRGLNRLHGRLREVTPGRSAKNAHGAGIEEAQAMEEMQYLLRRSRTNYLWPGSWLAWDMRTVEHNLCEFDKYERVRNGEGFPRQIFRQPGGK